MTRPFFIRRNQKRPAGAIYPIFEASITTGVAPLGVVVSAYSTNKDGETKPWRNLTYLFDFGETKVAYANGADPLGTPGKIVGGPCAGYCYETPGTYIIRGYVYDGPTLVAAVPITITVQDPDTVFSGTNTIACSIGGVFTGAPTGSNQQTVASYAAALAFLTSGKRVLLSRSDTWTPAASGTLSGTIDNAVLGSYGTGTRALLSCPVTGYTFVAPSGTGISNLIVRDLEVTGVTTTRLISSAASTAMIGLTVYNCYAHDCSNLVSFAAGGGIGAVFSNVERLTVYKNTVGPIIGGTGHNGMYLGIWRWGLILDNSIVDVSLAEHGIRCAFANDTFIHGNKIGDTASSKVALTIRSTAWNHYSGEIFNHLGFGKTSINVVVSNNRLYNGLPAGAAQCFHFGSQNPPSEPDRVTNSTFEGNLCISSGANASSLANPSGFGHTVRNNCYYMTTGAAYPLHVQMATQELAGSNDVVVTGDTFFCDYNPNAGAGAVSLAGGIAAGNVTGNAAYNNVLYAPTATDKRDVTTTVWQTVATNLVTAVNPSFAGPYSGLTTSIRAFIPSDASTLVAAGTVRPENRVDAVGRLRTATPTQGAFTKLSDTTSIWTLVP